MHWVGVAHNQGVDYLRAQLRTGKLHGRDICREAPVLLARDEARPVGHRTQAAAELVASARRALESEGPCRLRTASAAGAVSSRIALARPASMLDGRLSLDDYDYADSLMNGIGVVTLNASDAVSLAPQLDSITALAEGLDSVPKSVVYGTAALAMSSMEYWEENLVSTTYEAERDYCENEAPDPNAQACLEIPYSLVAPVALSTMVMQTDWGIIGSVAWSDAKVVISGGVVGWIVKALAWEPILFAAEVNSYLTVIEIAVKKFKERM